MALDVSKYLDVDVESLEAPKPLPIGHYFADITTWKGAERDYDKANGGPKTPVVEISFKVTAADDDIEADLLPSGYVNRILTRDYTLNNPDKTGQYMIRRLGEDTCKIPIKGLHLPDLLDALKGQPVKLYVEHNPPREEGGSPFPKITKVLPVD